MTAKALEFRQFQRVFSNLQKGGGAGSEGAVILSLSGEESAVREAFELIEVIKGEEQFDVPRLVPYIREPEAAPLH